MSTRLVNNIPMTFVLVPPINPFSAPKDPHWVTHLAQLDPNNATTRDIGYGYSPFDAYIDFCGKMGAC